jgi:hypothetical protein
MFKKGIKVIFVGFLDERKLRIFFLLKVKIYEKLKGGKSEYRLEKRLSMLSKQIQKIMKNLKKLLIGKK